MKGGFYFIAVVICGAVFAATASACQFDDGTGKPDGSVSPSPAETLPTPSEEIPEVPESATQHTKGGALAFGKHYYDLINYGRATGDWEPAKQVTAESCMACKDFWAKNPKRMDNNLSIRFETEPFVSRFLGKESRVVFRVSSDRNVTKILRDDREAWTQNIHMEYLDGAWKVMSIRVERSE